MKRYYHTWDKWECFRAGFFDKKPRNKEMTDDEAREAYAAFLRDVPKFKETMKLVLDEWPYSCEHNLSNENMNRIAWLGQSAACYALGIPAMFRGGFNLLTKEEQEAANTAALEVLNRWIDACCEPLYESVEAAASKTEMNLY
jgi:hypothetical protein